MRFLSTLATLLLGLAVVFWAPAAKAHCPGHEHCGPVDPGPPLLIDDNQDVVGVITNIRPDFVEVLLRLDSGPVTVMAHPGFLRGLINPRFETIDCKGDAFAATSLGSDLLGFMPPAAVGPPGFTIYVQADDVPIERTSQSAWFEGGCILLAVHSEDYRALVDVQQLLITPPFVVE